MNRRNFIQSVASILASIPVAGLIAEESAKAVEFSCSKWKWEPLQWSLPEKPCIATFRFDSTFGKWLRIQVRNKEEVSYLSHSKRNELTFIPFDGHGAWQLETGYDPETGCYDVHPESSDFREYGKFPLINV